MSKPRTYLDARDRKRAPDEHAIATTVRVVMDAAEIERLRVLAKSVYDEDAQVRIDAAPKLTEHDRAIMRAYIEHVDREPIGAHEGDLYTAGIFLSAVRRNHK